MELILTRIAKKKGYTIGRLSLSPGPSPSRKGSYRGVEHLVYASSSSVYGGNKKVPFSTDDRMDNPVSLYAATKKSNELFGHCYSKLYDIPTTEDSILENRDSFF